MSVTLDSAPTYWIKPHQWSLGLCLAVVLHAGVAGAVLWQNDPPPGAVSAGTGGIEVSLGPIGGSPGSAVPVQPDVSEAEMVEAPVETVTPQDPPPDVQTIEPPPPPQEVIEIAEAVDVVDVQEPITPPEPEEVIEIISEELPVMPEKPPEPQRPKPQEKPVAQKPVTEQPETPKPVEAPAVQKPGTRGADRVGPRGSFGQSGKGRSRKQPRGRQCGCPGCWRYSWQHGRLHCYAASLVSATQGISQIGPETGPGRNRAVVFCH